MERFKEIQRCIEVSNDGKVFSFICFENVYFSYSSKRSRIKFLRKCGFHYDSHLRCFRKSCGSVSYFSFFTKIS